VVKISLLSTCNQIMRRCLTLPHEKFRYGKKKQNHKGRRNVSNVDRISSSNFPNEFIDVKRFCLFNSLLLLLLLLRPSCQNVSLPTFHELYLEGFLDIDLMKRGSDSLQRSDYRLFLFLKFYLRAFQ